MFYKWTLDSRILMAVPHKRDSEVNPKAAVSAKKFIGGTNAPQRPEQTEAKRKMASQIPPLLKSYLSLPPETSQIVLTGILGASTNWLTLRYLYSLLRPATAAARLDRDGDADGAGEDVKVLLVSFMRDYSFWKEGAGRLVCILFLFSFVPRLLLCLPPPFSIRDYCHHVREWHY